MTRAEIRQQMRYVLNELGVDYLEDSSATKFDADQAVTQAYNAYAKATRCFPRRYSLVATVGNAIYGYGAFGIEAADTAAISVLAAADNTNPFTLITGQPSSTYIDRHYVTITIKGTGAGNAATYTVGGTLYGGIAYSEAVSWTTPELSAGGTFTKTTARPFATVTSITPSITSAQPAGWQHSAGVGAQSAGERMFEVTYVAFDTTRYDSALARRTADWMDTRAPGWRWDSPGTPEVWLPDGERMIRLWRPPDSALAIYVEGYETPDPTLFDADTDSPDVHEDDHHLLSIKAALSALPRDIDTAAAVRVQMFTAEYEAGLKGARKRIHGTGDEEIIFARHAGVPGTRDYLTVSPDIVNI